MADSNSFSIRTERATAPLSPTWFPSSVSVFGRGTSLGRLKVRKVVVFLLRYASVVFLIMLGATFYRELGRNNALFEVGFALSSVILALLLASRRVLPRRFLASMMTWLVFVLVSYSLSACATGTISIAKYMLQFGLLAVCPLFIYLLDSAGELENYLRSFTNVTAILGLASLLLWVAGPMLGIIEPNCSLPNTWNADHRLIQSPGYYGLLFKTQWISIGATSIARNTGVFLEAPGYALVLFLAFSFELLFQKHPRKLVALVLFVVVVTSTSTIGIVLCLIVALYCRFIRLPSARKGLGGFDAATVGLLVLCGVVGIYLVFTRLGTGSGIARIDDYYAGLQAWANSPVWGYGFGDASTKAIVPFMDPSRLDNASTANSIVQVLCSGGLLLAAVFLIAFLTFSACSRREEVFFGFLLFCLFCVSGVWGTWSFILALSIGVERSLAAGFKFGVPMSLDHVRKLI